MIKSGKMQSVQLVNKKHTKKKQKITIIRIIEETNSISLNHKGSKSQQVHNYSLKGASLNRFEPNNIGFSNENGRK